MLHANQPLGNLPWQLLDRQPETVEPTRKLWIRLTSRKFCVSNTLTARSGTRRRINLCDH